MSSDTKHQGENPLHILIAGAGIGGLCTALALRQQGHKVELFEQSKLSQETGAAIHLAPNCNGLLRRLGLLAEDIGAVECTNTIEYFPKTNELKHNVPVKLLGGKLWAHAWHLVHRAHLHTALREMAIGEEGKGYPAKLHLGSRVVDVDPETATLTLDDGTRHQGDLLLGGDGVGSRVRRVLAGCDKKPFDSGKSAFRFLIPTETLEADAITADIIKPSSLIMWIAEDRRVVMYPCVNNTMMNFVCIHPSAESSDETKDGGWQQTGSKERLLEIYKDFHPSIRAILAKAKDAKVWRLLDMEQLPTFIHGRTALIGDAAHPFLPHQGQGGGQAIEDGVALAALLPLGTSPEDLPERLKLYEQCRYERSHKIQGFTRLAGKDATELAAEGKQLNMYEFLNYNFGHDAWDSASDVLQKYLAAKDRKARYRSPLSFGPSPGPRRPLGLDAANHSVQALRSSKPETSTTYAIRFRTSRTCLERLLPPGFAFTSPGTVAYASISCTTLDGMTWLGGGGYSHCGLYIHGTEYKKADGEKLYGTFLPILFENLADPIITGRDELGMPKLFADIDVEPSTDSTHCEVSLGWRGAVFGKLSVSGLVKEEAPATNGTTATQPTGPPPGRLGPPPPPPEQGQFTHRYVPSVGEPGKADADYAVFISTPEPAADASKPEVLVSKTATLNFEARDWQSLPTLHHVAKALAEVPIYEVAEAKLTKASGVSDVGGARRI